MCFSGEEPVVPCRGQRLKQIVSRVGWSGVLLSTLMIIFVLYSDSVDGGANDFERSVDSAL